jgi:hypothetical protein
MVTANWLRDLFLTLIKKTLVVVSTGLGIENERKLC